ncbi:hypothetical protein QP185_06855 [Sphingomonas aerolata]|uniref:hypothetical protein n=1 Tax=Sphingomonas aerolata TaxID=185951 RepID=UPI002FE0C1C0
MIRSRRCWIVIIVTRRMPTPIAVTSASPNSVSNVVCQELKSIVRMVAPLFRVCVSPDAAPTRIAGRCPGISSGPLGVVRSTRKPYRAMASLVTSPETICHALMLLMVLPFAAALMLALGARGRRRMHVGIAAGASAAGLALLLLAAPAVLAGTPLTARIAWIPALGLDLSLWLDPLGLLFAGLILGIGLLVVIYAQGYLAKAEPTGRFLSFLMLFQGAMIGIALSNNILLMLIFWELTSLSSFLLIGFGATGPTRGRARGWRSR